MLRQEKSFWEAQKQLLETQLKEVLQRRPMPAMSTLAMPSSSTSKDEEIQQLKAQLEEKTFKAEQAALNSATTQMELLRQIDALKVDNAYLQRFKQPERRQSMGSAVHM